MRDVLARSEEAGVVHEGWFYDSDEAMLTAAEEYLRHGVERGDLMMLSSSNEHLWRLGDRLGDQADDIRFISEDAFYDHPARVLAAVRALVDEGGRRGRRVRVMGRPRWLHAEHTRKRDWLRLESLMNDGLLDRGCDLCCLYDIRTVPAPLLDDLYATHPWIRRLTDDGAPSPGMSVRRNERFRESQDYLAALYQVPLPEPPATAVSAAFDRTQLPELRQTVTACALSARLPAERIREVTLAVHELAANIVTHGGGTGRMYSWTENGSLVYQLNGPRWVSLPVAAGFLAPPLDALSGRGLWLAHQLSEAFDIGVTRDGQAVRIQVGLPRPA